LTDVLAGGKYTRLDGTETLHVELGPANRDGRRRIYRVQVLDRIMRILNCFRHEAPERTFAEIIGEVKLDKSTLYRLLEALRSHELIAVDRMTGKYSLGMKLFELGAVSINRLEASKLAMPALERLAEQTGETAHLCVLDGSEVIYIAKVESKLAFRMPSNIGRRNLAYCTGVGKALLAYLAEEQLETYLAQTPLRRFTRNTIISPAKLERHLLQIRSRGYSVDDQEIEEGLRCIGAPVRDHSGSVVAAISIAGPAMRIAKKNVTDLAACVMDAADEISEQLGFSEGQRAKSDLPARQDVNGWARSDLAERPNRR